MKKSLILLFTIFSINAFAEDKFSGFYAGGQLGYVNAKNKGPELDRATGTNTTYGWRIGNISAQGLAYGIDGGFNQVLRKRILFGIEANIEKRNFNNDEQIGHYPDGSTVQAGYPLKTEFTNAKSLKARVGYVLNNDSTLVYMAGGIATARVKSTLFGCGSDGYAIKACDYQANTLKGWTTGAGLEHFFKENISAKVEYNYVDYGTLDIDATTYQRAGIFEHRKFTENALRVGINYHF